MCILIGSSGIGLELAREYLRQGANVTIAARDMGKLQAAHEVLSKGIQEGSGQKIMHVSVDCGKSLSEGDEELIYSRHEVHGITHI